MMAQFKEKISWKIDGIDKKDNYDNAINFVHSFKLKCDCVGWCNMNLTDKSDFKLLEQICESAKQKKGTTRCCYEKEESFYESDWYILKATKTCEYVYNEGVKVYKLTQNDNIAFADDIMIANERFVKFCIENGFTGVNFAYVRDVSRYKSNTYYAILPTENIKAATDVGNKFSGKYKHHSDEYRLIDSFGGNLSRVSKCFDQMQFIDYPLMLPNDIDIQTDFCYIAYKDVVAWEILIKKTVADLLLDSKLISKHNLVPVRYCDATAHKKLLTPCRKKEFLPQSLTEAWSKNREIYESKIKPSYVPNEKDAINLLKNAKKERKEDFSKPLSKKISETIDAELSVLTSVFKVSDGCYINDEMYLLPFVDIKPTTQEFFKNIANEELNLNGSFVIGNIINGDNILLNKNQTVMVLDHEDIFQSITYDTFWEFLFDNLV